MERIAVVGPQLRGAERHNLRNQRLGQGVLALRAVELEQMNLGGKRILVLGP